MNPENALITCDPESEAFALTELRALRPSLPAPRWVDDGVALVETGTSFASFAAEIARASPIFIQHLAPVQREVALHADESDLQALTESALSLASHLDPARSFAVQTRILGEGRLPYRRFTVNNALSERLQAAAGTVMDCRKPEQILSVFCTPAMGYLGHSLAAHNRSDWPGGQHRFQREADQISRAEFKLLEACALFGLTLPSSGRALDLGAAPGGWTRVLRMAGMSVVALDPAELDARLSRDRSVTHIRKRVEDYLPADRRFDVIVNDMRMDALDSAGIMVQAMPSLKPDGFAILTLKLLRGVSQQRDNLVTVRHALERLRRVYRVLDARQLYHNRSEVTVALRPQCH